MDPHAVCRLRHSASVPNVGNMRVQSPSARAHWHLLRMNFITFPRAYRQLRQQQWQAIIAAARAQQAGKQQSLPASAGSSASAQPAAVPVAAF